MSTPEPVTDLVSMSITEMPVVQCAHCWNQLELNGPIARDERGWYVVVRHPDRDFARGLPLPAKCGMSGRRFRYPLKYDVIPELP